MRVSTAQFYFQNSQQLSNKQGSLNEETAYISSGKKILTAKDDAISYSTLAGYKDELANIEKYQRNVTQAESRNSLQDVTFSGMTNILNELKYLMLQANNGVYGDEDLKTISQQASNSFEQMLDFANSKDETGNYIFSGFQIGTEPFSLQTDNTVIYNGDTGNRELQIAKNIMVDTNFSGEQAFEKVANKIGDFSAQYNTNTSGVFVNNAVISDRSIYDPVANPPNYNFNFTSSTDLTVQDANGVDVYTTTSYTAGQTISFNGVEVELSGNPLPGDNFDLTPQANISVFDTMKQAIAWLDAGTNPQSDEKHQVEYNAILSQLDSTLNHISSQRAESGIRLQLIERTKNNHLDTELYLNSSRSAIEDLDFAKAISEFEQSKVALQAAQQTFSQIQRLTLFNYL